MGKDRATMQAYDFPNDRQAQTNTLPPLTRTISLPKAIKHRPKRSRIDASSRINHDDSSVRIYELQSDLNLTVYRSELDRIGNQVPDHLLKPPRIAGNRTNAGINDLLQRDGLGVRRRTHAFDPCVNDFSQVDALHVKTQTPAFYPQNVEQVFDQLTLGAGSPFDSHHAPAGRFR